ncbi:MAG: HAD-IA family hydrolase [Planctomycetota bacterium]
MPPFQALLLDAGNTLFREVPSRAEIYADTARSFGLEVDPRTMASAMRAVHAALPREIEGDYRYSEGWFRHFIDNVFSGLGLTRPIEEVQRALIEVFSKPSTFQPYPETRAVLKRLKGAGVPMAVVSNWSPRLPALLSGLGLGKDFDAIITSAIIRAEKPDGAIFRRALEQLRRPAEVCVHVGDHLANDVAGAHAAGISARLVDRQGEHPLHPDRIESLVEVLDLFGLPRTTP